MPVDLSKLNSEQLLPVKHTEGAVLVTAGAGSGKTRLLTHRIAYIIDDLGVKPYQILAITFTNKAADEMKERLAKMIDRADDIWVMTFHALCVRILRKDIDKLGYTKNFSIYTQSDSDRLLTRLAGEISKEDDFPKKAVSVISDAKNKSLSAGSFRAKLAPHLKNGYKYADVFDRYEDALKKNNSVDFDGLLTHAHRLLSEFPETAEYYQTKFKYIHVDEFQDTNDVQYQIIKLLAAKHGNILAVGDEDQSIYGWRGARVSNIFDFQSDFKCGVYKLEQNYRSTKKILEVANRIIANNTERMPKVLWTEKGDGVRTEFFAAENEGTEADYVVSAISALKDYAGFRNSDFAILMRVNALSRSFEEKLSYYNMQYKLFGGQKFYERKEIKDIMAYLKLIVNPADTESLSRIINFPKRNIGEATFEQLARYCDVENKRAMDVILDIKNNDELPASIVKKIKPFAEIMSDIYAAQEKTTLPEFLKYILARINIMGAFIEDTEENYNRRLNVEEFFVSVENYAKANPNKTLEDYLMAISLYADTDEMDFDADYTTIATVHSAKGLEFKVVFVVGLEDGLFPGQRAMDSVSQLEEERRLMYVAVTRAKERLYLTYSKTRFMYGQRKAALPSRFLREAFPAPAPEKTAAAQSSFERGGEYGDRYGSRFGNKYGGDDDSPSYGAARPQTFSSAASVARKVEQVKDFCTGDKVRHKKFGDGIVMETEGTGNTKSLKIDFEKAGVLKLLAAFAPLEPAE